MQAGRLAILDVAQFPVMRRWYAVHRRGKHLPAVARAFAQFLEAEGEAGIVRQLPPAIARLWKRRPPRMA